MMLKLALLAFSATLGLASGQSLRSSNEMTLANARQLISTSELEFIKKKIAQEATGSETVTLPLSDDFQIIVDEDLDGDGTLWGGFSLFEFTTTINPGESVVCDVTMEHGNGDGVTTPLTQLFVYGNIDNYPFTDSDGDYECQGISDTDYVSPAEETCTVLFPDGGKLYGIIGVIDAFTESQASHSETYTVSVRCGDTDDEDGCSCFSDASLVEKYEQGPTPITEIQVGDSILVGRSYEPVYAFAHLDKDAETEFLQISTEANKKTPLEITGEHMLLVNGKYVPASTVVVGDNLETNDGAATVTKVDAVTKTGLYAPLTPSGSIVVNGIKASAYVALQEGGKEFAVLQGGYPIMSQQSLIHMYLSPLRMACMGVHEGFCRSIDHDTGYHWFVGMGIDFAKWSTTQNIFVQIVSLVLFVAVFGSFYLLECLFGATSAPSVLMLAAGGFAFSKKAGSVKAFIKNVKLD